MIKGMHVMKGISQPIAAQMTAAFRSITGCSIDAQFRKGLFTGETGLFIQRNLEGIQCQAEVFTGNQRAKDLFFEHGFPHVCVLARKHGLKPFTKIAGANPDRAWAISGMLVELEDLVERIGINPFVDLIRRYESADHILWMIRGREIEYKDSEGNERTRYEHSMVSKINSAEELSEYAVKIDYFYKTAGHLQMSGFRTGRLVDTYGIDSLGVIAKLAVFEGENAFEWGGRGRLVIEKAMDRFEPMIDAFGYNVFEQLIDEIGNCVYGLTDTFPAMHELYSSPEAYHAAAKQMVDMSKRGKAMLRSSDGVLFVSRMSKGLFESDQNRRLVVHFGLDAFDEAFAGTEKKSRVLFFDILAEVADLIESPDDLKRFIHRIFEIEHSDRDGIRSCLQQIPHLITSYESFSRVLEILDELKSLFGLKKLARILKGKGSGIQSTEELKSAPFNQEENRKFVKCYGLTALTEKIPHEDHAFVLARTAQFSHLVETRKDLDRLIDMLVPMRDSTRLGALRHTGHLVDSFDRLAELGEALQALCEECPTYVSEVLPSVKSLIGSIDDFYGFGDAAIKVASVANKYERYGEKSVFADIVGILERGLIETPNDFELYGLEVANINRHSSEIIFRSIREENKISDQEQMLEEMRRNARLRLSPHLQSELEENDELKRRVFDVNFNYFEYDYYKPPADIREGYAKIMEGLARHNITRPLHFNTSTAREIIRNRDQINQPDDRPVALLVYPKSDWNTAFESNSMIELMEMGYRILYFEAVTSSDFRDAVVKVGSVQQISLMVIGGHGFLTHLNFGLEDKTRVKDGERDYYLDISRPQVLDGLSEYLAPQSIVVLESCSTGAGRDRIDNLANMVGRAFPHSTIMAATIPTNILGYIRDEEGRIIDVNFRGPEDSYIILPVSLS
jgi:hypothetical protein